MEIKQPNLIVIDLWRHENYAYKACLGNVCITFTYLLALKNTPLTRHTLFFFEIKYVQLFIKPRCKMKKSLLLTLIASTMILGACESTEVDTIENPFESAYVITDNVELGPDEKKLRLTHHTYFLHDAVFVDEKSMNNIAAHASFIIQHPEIKVLVEGHADESGEKEYNRKLGMRRAKSVATVLKTFGVDESQITLRSYSTNKPLSKFSKALNRRATIIY